MISRLDIVFMLPCSSQKRTRKRSVSNTQGISTFLNSFYWNRQGCAAPWLGYWSVNCVLAPCLGCWPWLGCCPLICMLAPWFACWPMTRVLARWLLFLHGRDGYWPFRTGMVTDPAWQGGYWHFMTGMGIDPSWHGWVLTLHDRNGYWPLVKGMGTDC